MTDHAKHIEALKEAKRNGRLLPDEHRAVDAAIALMQAAQPKDAEAEREHCTPVAYEQKTMKGLLDSEFVEEQRAAARAEGYTRIDAMQTELAAAKAENEQLRHWNDELRADAKQTYEAGLALGLAKDIPAALAYDLVAAKAEIERLTAELQQTKAALAAANILLSGAFA